MVLTYSEVFASLDRAEKILSKQRFIAGSRFTEADLRLFVTLIRFDEVSAQVTRSATQFNDYFCTLCFALLLSMPWQCPSLSQSCWWPILTWQCRCGWPHGPVGGTFFMLTLPMPMSVVMFVLTCNVSLDMAIRMPRLVDLWIRS